MVKFKLIDNPFRREKNAEYIDFDEIYSLFAEPPNYEKYLQPGHCVLIGSTGSGKSAVLKALSLPVQLKKDKLENLPFYGVYIGFKNPELKHLVRLYEDYDDVATFEHFFSVKVVLELLMQLKDNFFDNDYKMLEILPRLINEEYMLNITDINVNTVIERLKEVISMIRKNTINNRPIRDFSNQLNMRSLSLDMFISTIERINEQVLAKIGKQKLCLLVDKYDYWKGLSQVLNTLLDQSLKDTLYVRFAARYLPESFSADISGRKIDLKRDLDLGILSLDQDPYDPQYEIFLRKIAINILSLQGKDEIDITKVFSEKSPPNIEPYIDKDSSPGENLRRLHSSEKGTSRNMREKLYYGFDCLTKLSGGNILTFLNLCEKAIDEEIKRSKKQTKKVSLVSAESQAGAFISLSRLTFNKDVNVETENEFRELRSFILSLGKECEKKGLETDSFEGSRFSIPLNISEAVKNILRKGFLHRFLLCGPEELISININRDYVPIYSMLNPLFAPRFGNSWMNKGIFPLTNDKIIEYMLFPIGDQPDADYFHSRQQKMFPEHPVFISISIKNDKKVIERNNLLKGTVNVIHKEDMKDRPRLLGLSEQNVCITARDLWKRDLHRFVIDIPNIIQKTIYTTHDITPIEYEIGRGKEKRKEKRISTGVCFEIGLSLGYKSPFFLYNDCRYEQFDAENLPKLLRDWDVKKWNPSFPDLKNMSFKEWYREAIHQHGFSSFKKNWICPFDKEKPSCDYESEISQGKEKVYIAFQPRNRKQRDYLINLLSTKYKIFEISPSDYPMNDLTCQVCFALKSCIIKIIDCTEAMVDFVVELGLAEAIDASSVIYAYDVDLWDNPVLMSRALPCAWHRNTYKQNIEYSLEDFMIKFRLGGEKMSIRPINTVRPIESSKPDDLFIASVSFEPRCLNVSTKLKKGEYKARNILIVGYYGEDPLKEKHQRKIKEILESYLESPSYIKEPVYFNKYDSSKFTRFLLDFAHENSWLERITIDISTLTKQYVLLLLRFLRSNYPNAKIRLLYTPGYYMVRQNLTWGIKDITYLPYFGNPDCVELQRNILILLLGYEGERAYAIWKYVEPALTVAVIGSPPGYHGADLPSRSANRFILDHPNTVVEEIPALDPDCTQDLLNRWYHNEKYEDYMFSITPLGTKMQTVGVYLFFEENNYTPRAQIVYAFPLFYNKRKYTIDFDKEIREFYLPRRNTKE